MDELEEDNPMPFEKVIESIVHDKLKNNEIKKEDLNGLELGVDDLKEYEDHFNSLSEPFGAAESVKVDEVDEREAAFLSSNLSFVNEVILSSVQLTTKIANMNEIAEECHFYEPKVTPVMHNSSFESVRYIIMKVDEDIDKEKAKKKFSEAVDNPDKFHDGERYLVLKGKFTTINAPYSRDSAYKVRIK